MRLLTSLSLSLLTLVSAQTSGLGIEITKAVDCKRKTKNGDKISVHYKGTLQEGGKKFDSSYDRGKPFSFTIGNGQVIQGWEMGLLGMCIGEGRRLTIPPGLAYGNEQNKVIPAMSTLIFETELMGIAGVEPEAAPERPAIAKPEEEGKTEEKEKEKQRPEETSMPAPIPVPTSIPPPASSVTEPPATSTIPAAEPTKSSPGDKGPMDDDNDNECHLLGKYALIVQGALGLLAVSSLVYKRWREYPRRPLKIWFFDASKQVFGSVLLHLANILMSMLSSGSFDVAAKTKATPQFAGASEDGETPNPCSFYLLNLAIDTTIGIPILVLLLKLFHRAFLLTPLANPPESIRSGNYGHPPRATWWLKQSVIYFLGLFGMKLCVFVIFQLLPWIAWVGDWALRWTEGNEAIQITFVMFIFPLIMNALQYWIIDGFIKDTGSGGSDYVGVGDESDEEDEEWLERHRRERRSGEDEDSDVGAAATEPLKEANPTAIPVRSNTGKGRDYDPETDGAPESSRDGRKG